MKYKATGRAAIAHRRTWGKANISQYSHGIKKNKIKTRDYFGVHYTHKPASYSTDPRCGPNWNRRSASVLHCALQKDAASWWGSWTAGSQQGWRPSIVYLEKRELRAGLEGFKCREDCCTAEGRAAVLALLGWAMPRAPLAENSL